MYYSLIIERLNGVALFESNNNNFKNLNRIKNRKEKRLKGGKKKKKRYLPDWTDKYWSDRRERRKKNSNHLRFRKCIS